MFIDVTIAVSATRLESVLVVTWQTLNTDSLLFYSMMIQYFLFEIHF